MYMRALSASSVAGALACTHTRWTHKMDFPTLDWPYTDFPQLLYPLSDNVDANRREEDRCLQMVRIPVVLADDFCVVNLFEICWLHITAYLQHH